MTAVARQLHDFAAALLERRGAVVDWPADEAAGLALLPPDVAAAVGAASEEVPLGADVAGGGLSVNLAGDFLDWTLRLLDAEPRVGLFRLRDMYLKRKEIDEAVARTFTWLNAKVKYRESREATIEYHTWWFHGAIASEDRWETRFSLTVNAATLVEVEIPDPLGLWELEPAVETVANSVADAGVNAAEGAHSAHDAEQGAHRAPYGPGAAVSAASSYAAALAIARRRLWDEARPFVERMDARLLRDRKRLGDYYRALVREAEKKKGRAGTPADPEKIEATKRAVELELRRKLAELDERYAMDATLRPVTLIRTRTPVLAVDLAVFRKQAQRVHRVYWNPLIKQFEPMACSRCGQGAYLVAFANETVAALCGICAAA